MVFQNELLEEVRGGAARRCRTLKPDLAADFARELNQSGAFQGRVGAVLIDRLHRTGGEFHGDMAPKLGDVNAFGPQIGTKTARGIGGNVCSDTSRLFRLTASDIFPAQRRHGTCDLATAAHLRRRTLRALLIAVLSSR